MGKQLLKHLTSDIKVSNFELLDTCLVDELSFFINLYFMLATPFSTLGTTNTAISSYF